MPSRKSKQYQRIGQATVIGPFLVYNLAWQLGARRIEWSNDTTVPLSERPGAFWRLFALQGIITAVLLAMVFRKIRRGK